MSVKTANAVFRGEALLDDGEIRSGFFKDLDPKQLANELLVATIAEELGVRVPRVALILVTPDVSTAFVKLPHASGTGHIALCSVDAKASTVAQIVTMSGELAVLPSLKTSPGLGKMYGLDTWVANVDRHANNILLSGAGDATLIDHGHCFSGPTWTSSSLVPSEPYINRLREWLTPYLTDEDKQKAMSDVHSLVAGIVPSDIGQLIQDSLGKELYGDEDSDALEEFLRARISHVAPLAALSLETLL